MRKLTLAALAFVLASSSSAAQTAPDPRVKSCDPKSALLNSPTFYQVQRATIVKTCWGFQSGLETFVRANLDSAKKLNGAQLLGWALHADPSFFLPKDTARPPVIVPDPTPAPPVDSTPKPPTPPKDTTPLPTAPAGYVAIANPNPMGPLTAPAVLVPKGWAGRPNVDIQPGGGCAGTDCKTGEGANRFLCAYAYMAFDDPIVSPGKPGVSHLHQFFGNTHVTAFTTADSIAAVGNSTCSGGTANRTGYWTPAMVDSAGKIVTPTTATIYYKSGYQMRPSLVQPTPTGLRMIAGDKTWTDTKQNQARVWWTCTDRGPAYSSIIPDCGDRVELIVIFPQCWNGKDLDSPDHKSHMAYPAYSNATNGSVCPKDWVVIPEITEEFFWKVPAGVRSSTWRISSDMDATKPGGLSAHADWMMGWQPDVMKTFVTLCLDQSKDCQVNGLGNNTYLNPPPL